MVFIVQRNRHELHIIPIEDSIIDYFIARKLYEPEEPEPYYYEYFIEWYYTVWRYKTSNTLVTINGDFITRANNTAYTVVEADTSIEAYNKANKIFSYPTQMVI